MTAKTRAELDEALDRALTQAAEKHEGLEYDGMADGVVGSVLLFLEVGTALAKDLVIGIDGGEDIEEGEQLGLVLFPDPMDKLERDVDHLGLRMRVDAIRNDVIAALSPHYTAILSDPDAPSELRDRAEKIAIDLRGDKPVADLRDDPHLEAIRAALTGGETSLGVRSFDPLGLEAGGICACDPGLVGGREVQAFEKPLARDIPPGAHATLGLFDDGLPIAIAVVFSQSILSSFEPAFRPNQNPNAYAARAVTGYPIDCGLGAVMGETTMAALRQRAQREKEPDWLIGPINAAGIDQAQVVLLDVGPSPDAARNTALVVRSPSDGWAEVYWGLDDAGQVHSLVTVLPR